jgi:hypothetical protein
MSSGHRAERTWQSDLVAAHPALFQIEMDGQAITPGTPDVGDGWQDLLERLVSFIAAAVSGAEVGWVRIVEIQKKFGTLRFYWLGADLSHQIECAIQDAVALAEGRSACTCEICGAEGRLYSRRGWLATACAEHARGGPVQVEARFENVHIVRIFDAGHHPIAACRRYDREIDSFVDVDPESPGIED